jgi:DNA-binding CsgD family transcriptional regulator
MTTLTEDLTLPQLYDRIESHLGIIEECAVRTTESRSKLQRLRQRLHDILTAQDFRVAEVTSLLDAELTDRERQIVRLYAYTDLTAKGVGDTLYITVDTVKTHLRKAYAKLGVSSRRELAVKVRELGIKRNE